MNAKNPWLAVNLSIFFPGIGQLYAQETLRGLILLIIEIILIAIAAWSLLSPTGNTILGGSCLLPIILVYIASIFDAHSCVIKKLANQPSEKIPRIKKDPWFGVMLSQILPGLGHLYIKKNALGICLLSLTIILATLAKIFTNFTIFLPLISAFACYHTYINFPQQRSKIKRTLITWVTVAILGMRIMSNYFPIWMGEQIEIFEIPSKSMVPTLQVGDRIIVKKSDNYQPKRGEIIVFNEPDSARKLDGDDYKYYKKEHFFIKRVIGKPGEILRVTKGITYINNQPLPESYIAEIPNYEMESIIVPNNCYFVLGDNRNNSFDSHVWGLLPARNIIGNAYKIYWPSDRMMPLISN